MLNRFKNVLYGSSAANNETCDPSNPNLESTLVRKIKFNQETIIEGRMRSRILKKSASFREALLGDRNNNNNNSNDISNGVYHHDKSQSSNGITNDLNDQQYSGMLRCIDPKVSKVPKFPYSRPEFLQLKTEDEILVSADHQIRPIILPRDVSKLPWRSGYAECINSGKSVRNEDQAACYQDVVISTASMLAKSSGDGDSITIERQLPWNYFGIFDGHAGAAVAVAAASQLHFIIEEKLRGVLDLIIALEFDSEQDGDNNEHDDDDDSVEYIDCMNEDRTSSTSKETPPEDGCPTKGDENPTKVSENDEEDERNSSSSRELKDNTTGDQLNGCLEPSDAALLTQQPTSSNETKIKPIVDDKHRQQKNNNSRRQQQQLQQSPDTRLLSMIDICRNNVTVDSLIIGALESAFWEMDLMIARDKTTYKMAGGCTAVISLFIVGKLYVCNAGDSRAVVYKNDRVIPMSYDFTPISERDRIMRIGQQHPEFLGAEFTHLEFLRRPTRRDLGKQMLYKDAYMTGWSMKTIDYDDLRIPLVWGEGKRSRVLATMGVTRGFGDHELRAHYGSLLIKPFLTPEPEVKVLALEKDETLTPEDVLIMGSDGLWDVTSNQKAADIVKGSFDLFPDNEESRSKYRYITAAQDLVIHSRGHATNWNNVWRIDDDRLASLDDIAVFVIPLKQYRDEYLEWKGLRAKATKRKEPPPSAVIHTDRKPVDESIGDG